MMKTHAFYALVSKNSTDKGKTMEKESYTIDNEQKIVYTRKETDKKCDMCGGIMNFSPEKGMLHCIYCGFVKPIDTDGITEEIDFDINEAEKSGNYDWGAATKTVICQSCGGETVYDEMQTSGECPYCGSSQVMVNEGSASLAPNGVCPFRIPKEEAGSRFSRWLKGKLFCPSRVKKAAKPDSFKGIYLPYWTFDADTSTSFTAKYGIVRTVSTGKGKTRTVVDWYPISGYHEQFIDDEIVAASNNHDESLVNGITPFDTAASEVYKPEYISGFASEKYSVGLGSAWEKAKGFIASRLKNAIEILIKNKNHADRVSNIQIKTSYSNVKYKYLLLPVWISSFAYKGRIYQFMVNGQTGKISGKTPLSPLRIAIAAILIIFALALVFYYGSDAELVGF